jgi:hypothetical protein
MHTRAAEVKSDTVATLQQLCGYNSIERPRPESCTMCSNLHITFCCCRTVMDLWRRSCNPHPTHTNAKPRPYTTTHAKPHSSSKPYAKPYPSAKPCAWPHPKRLQHYCCWVGAVWGLWGAMRAWQDVQGWWMGGVLLRAWLQMHTQGRIASGVWQLDGSVQYITPLLQASDSKALVYGVLAMCVGTCLRGSSSKFEARKAMCAATAINGTLSIHVALRKYATALQSIRYSMPQHT